MTLKEMDEMEQVREREEKQNGYPDDTHVGRRREG